MGEVLACAPPIATLYHIRIVVVVVVVPATSLSLVYAFFSRRYFIPFTSLPQVSGIIILYNVYYGKIK
jgi:hypothetical protein